MNPRDLAILELVFRYHVMTNAVLLELLFEGCGLKAVERVTQRLVRQGLLCSRPLFGRQHFLGLTPAGARQLGLDPRRYRRPMGTASLMGNLAILLFCCGGDVQRERLAPQEFAEAFPDCVCPGLRNDLYYLDDLIRPGQTLLALLAPDRGQSARRLAGRVRGKAERHRKIRGFGELMARGLFAITCLVPTPGKKRQLEGLLAPDIVAGRLVAEVVVIEELTHFFPETPENGRPRG